MTDKPQRSTSDGQTEDQLFDPETLRDREDVEFCGETRVHDDAQHCAVGSEGRAVVGVTNDDGAVLAIVDDESEFALLPSETVDSGEDWATVGRERVEHLFDLPVEIAEPRRVRSVEHVVEGDDEPQMTSYEVVFEASPAADPATATDGCDWHADWLETFPEDAANDGGAPEADVRLFVD